jgi:hypothetical protein
MHNQTKIIGIDAQLRSVQNGHFTKLIFIILILLASRCRFSGVIDYAAPTYAS